MRFFYYAPDAIRARQRQLIVQAAVAAGRNRLGKFPATVIQTRVARRKTTVPVLRGCPFTAAR